MEDLVKVQKGDILVAVTTHPDYEPAMKRAAAIVTNQGGILSHAAINARTDNVPCIVDTVDGTKRLNDGELVEVDAVQGKIRRLNKRHAVHKIVGTPASQGVAEGKVVVVRGIKDLHKVKLGSVLVAVTTNPEYVAAIHSCVAVVTNQGGVSSHAGIACREYVIPCVVNNYRRN